MLPLQNFLDYIRQNTLFEQQHRILLTVSGGKDSVLMVQLFKKAGFNFGIAHCNFGLRGGESQRDEHFVRTLAAVMDVPLHITHFETKSYAAAHKVSTQMAARDLRYAWFAELCIAHQYDRIAVAHHQDDAIETVLLNLVRGTGIAGMHGILPKRGNIVRPLLFLSRKAIDQLVDENEIGFVEDSSNLSSTYARNKLRLEIIPALKEVNPNLEQTFEHNIRRFAETEIVLQQAVLKAKQEICSGSADELYLSIEGISMLHPQQLLLFEILKEYHFTEAVVGEVLAASGKQSGTSFYSVSHRLTIDRDALIVTPFVSGSGAANHMVHPADTQIELADQVITLHFSDSVGFENDPQKAYIDADQLSFPLVVRPWQDGDRFKPLGMSNYKNLSDFFIDQKIPVPQKSRIPLLVNGNGDIVWVAGLRQDNRYKVTARTKKVAIFEQKFK
jgi:tRNA(Ile)-lysidine synthase